MSTDRYFHRAPPPNENTKPSLPTPPARRGFSWRLRRRASAPSEPVNPAPSTPPAARPASPGAQAPSDEIRPAPPPPIVSPPTLNAVQAAQAVLAAAQPAPAAPAPALVVASVAEPAEPRPPPLAPTVPATAPPPVPQPSPPPAVPAAPAEPVSEPAAPQHPQVPPPPASTWPRGLEYAVLAMIALLALALRLRDPLSNPIVGAEDPYLHMERTWNLAQGQAVHDYPPGLMILLFPLTLLGPHTFYAVMRFLPAFVGTGSVVAMYFLCRPFMVPAGALGSSLVLATMRENIFRTDILTPTAIDMLLIPILLLSLIRASQGVRRALYTTGATTLAIAAMHPWALGLLVVPCGVYWVVMMFKQETRRKWALPAAAGGFALFLLVLTQFAVWSPTRIFRDQAIPRFLQLAGHPSGILPLPQYVDLPHMLGWAALLLGLIGFGLTFARRSPLNLLAAIWCALLLPLVLVDWFGLWYIPHRTVVYFGLGLAVLGGLAVAEISQFLVQARPSLTKTSTAIVLVAVGLVMMPNAVATQSWYRIYDDNDFAAWNALEARGTHYVMAGSWEQRAGYRALTAGDAVYNPAFFNDSVVRDFEYRNHPDMVVLISNETARDHLDTSFLSTWHQIGKWGDVEAYTKSSP